MVDIFYTPEGYISLNLKPRSEYIDNIKCVYNLELHLHDRIKVDNFDWSKTDNKIEMVIQKVVPLKWDRLEVESVEVHHNEINKEVPI